MMQKDSGQSRNYYLRAGRHTLIGNWIEQITDFFFPWGTYCVCCGNFIDRQRSYCICDHCMQKIGWGRIEVPVDGVKQTKKGNDRNTILMFDEDFPLDSIRCCMKYGLYERRFIFALKYNGYTYMARIIARIMSDRVLYDPSAVDLLRADFIIPVPVHKEKLKQRGFNQMEKIGGYCSKFLGIPILNKGLRRNKNTAAQRSVAGIERYDNLQGAFEPGPDLKHWVKGKHVLLIDDVFTTGATALHCGNVLKKAGAHRVDFLALATGNSAAEGFFDVLKR